MLTLGIDDAGRGPIIGPMILAGVLITKEQEKNLKKYEIRDSKTVLQALRIKLSKVIIENSTSHKILIISPTEIDSALTNPDSNLNKLEAIKTAEIINGLNHGKFLKQQIKVIVDCPSVNVSAWKKTLLKFVSSPSNLLINCEHKADANHLSVSAASILAKVVREEEVSKLKNKYGDLGSGYPSDPVTKEFLKKHGKSLSISGIFRKTWSTWKKLYPDKHQAILKDF